MGRTLKDQPKFKRPMHTKGSVVQYKGKPWKVKSVDMLTVYQGQEVGYYLERPHEGATAFVNESELG